MAIDQLPDVVLFELFPLLNWEEKIRLKGVCRRFNSLLTDHLTKTSRRLFVHDKIVSLNENWGSPDKPVKCGELIHVNLLLKCLEFGYFKNVKCLYLYDLNDPAQTPYKPSPHYQNSILLSCLARLDELFVSDAMEVYDLPNLKSKSLKFQCFPVRINSQRLEKLVFWNFWNDSVSLSNPEMVRHIECRDFTEKRFQIDSFPNLESLNCQSISVNFQLSNYPKLKKLGVCPSRNDLEEEFNKLKRLIAEKQALRRSDLEITVSGFKGIDSTVFEEKIDLLNMKAEDVRKLRKHFANFVGPVPGYTEIFLDPSVDLKNLSKFTRHLSIRMVELNGNPNPGLVIKFLREINGVSFLSLVKCSYGPEFYNQLTSVPFINEIEFEECQMSAVTNYDFIGTIKFLWSVSFTDTVLPLEELEEIMWHLVRDTKVDKVEFWYNRSIESNRIYFGIRKSADEFDDEFYGKYSLERPFFVNFRTCAQMLDWKGVVSFVRECEEVNRQSENLENHVDNYVEA